MTLRAKDIVSASDGDVSFATAGKWLKSSSPSIAVKYALMYFKMKLSSAGIFQPKKEVAEKPVIQKKTSGTYAGKKVEFDEPVVTMEPKIPATTQIHRPVRGGQTIFDKPMTYRPRNIGNHYFIAVYLDSGWYKVDAGTEKFEIDGVVYSMSDFKLAD